MSWCDHLFDFLGIDVLSYHLGIQIFAGVFFVVFLVALGCFCWEIFGKDSYIMRLVTERWRRRRRA